VWSSFSHASWEDSHYYISRDTVPISPNYTFKHPLEPIYPVKYIPDQDSHLRDIEICVFLIEKFQRMTFPTATVTPIIHHLQYP
jgi:hypothetical protein